MSEIPEKNKKKLERLALFSKNPALATQQQIEAVIDSMEEIKNAMPPAFLGVLKGDPGKNGETPTKEYLENIIKPLIPDVKNGENYVLTEQDKEDIAKKVNVPIVEKIVEKKEVVREIPIVTNEVKEVAVAENGEQIVEKINNLPVEKDFQIDFSHIKNVPEHPATPGGIGGVRNIQVLDEDAVLTKTLKKIKFSGAGVQASIVDGIVVVQISGGAAANERKGQKLTNSGDDLNFTSPDTPTSVSVVWLEESGQIITDRTGDTSGATGIYYTRSGSTFTFNQSVAGFTVRSNYTY